MSATSETIAIVNTPQLLSVNISNVTKLTASNFIMWSRQVHALLDGYDLAGYIDGSVIVPPPTVTTDSVTTTNPDYTLWKHQDRLLYSSLLGTIVTTVQPLLSRATTSAEIWTTLTNTYAAPSRSHIQQIRHQIQAWKKGTKLVDHYFLGLTMRFDKLAVLGAAMAHEDQVEAGWAFGYPFGFRVGPKLEGREKTPTLPEVYEKLLHHEVKLQTIAATSPPSFPATANAVNFRGGSSGGFGNRNQLRNKQQYRSNYSTPNQTGVSRPNNGMSRGYQGRCQICGIHGHSARTCSQLHQGGFTSHPRAYAPWQPRANLVTGSGYDVHP
ncbi:PREDICTED: uncharacterized protein LOC104748593 [Camelina sativa]|uniref:Uncharacterized protein LOC104748593 n=1 Tax=Camelina sativa TaxID=90675 RepID=A0ABM0WB99_CAMSA|nr:PREDICTED: uncharacterized protein LOC104748593 [Camelina sativa]